ncbi:MAG TPA: thioredoxin family protein [Chloroflexota bacterium]|nr:thioredoxin family protein [Chloroflexota bacterium]
MNPRRLTNQYSYVLVGSLALLAGAAYVSRDPTPARWIAWLAAVGILYALYLFLRPGEPTLSPPHTLEQELGKGYPVLVELYSNFCIACMVVKPVVDGLDHEPGVRARFIRIDISTPEGHKVARQCQLQATPTFIGLDSQGVEQWRLIGGATNRQDLVARLRRLT